MRVSDYSPPFGHRVPLGIIFSTTVVSQTTPGVRYKVQLQGNGEWTCECPGFHHRSYCKHVVAEKAHHAARKTSPLSALL